VKPKNAHAERRRVSAIQNFASSAMLGAFLKKRALLHDVHRFQGTS
jgi:hypothetical protein